MATKTKKSTAKKSTPKTHSYEGFAHPFPPGTDVEVYKATDVDVERRAGREPIGSSVAKGSVNDQGLLKITGIKDTGQYQAAAEVTVRPVSEADATASNTQPFEEFRYFGFTIK